MALQPYDTIVLAETVPSLIGQDQNFLLDTFFPGYIQSQTEFVALDIEIAIRRVAPYADPLVEAKFVEQIGMLTKVFKPPYIKDKRRLDLLQPVRRMPGQPIGAQGVNPAQNEAANVARNLREQIQMINRRLEVQAGQILTTGMATISGEGVPQLTIDYDRNANLTVALTGNATWDSGTLGITASPSADLDLWSQLGAKFAGTGYTDVLMTPTPYRYFMQDPIVKESIFFMRSGGSELQLGGQVVKPGIQFKGYFGEYRIWVYNDWYVDPSTPTQQTRIIADGNVIMVNADQMLGSKSFAAILDPELAYPAVPYAPKSWFGKDPAGHFMMMQSAPLLIPARPNATFCANVCTARSF